MCAVGGQAGGCPSRRADKRADKRADRRAGKRANGQAGKRAGVVATSAQGLLHCRRPRLAGVALRPLCCMQDDALPKLADKRWGGSGCKPRTLPTCKLLLPIPALGQQRLLLGDQVIVAVLAAS